MSTATVEDATVPAQKTSSKKAAVKVAVKVAPEPAKVKATPSKKYDVIALDKLTWHRDPTTENGEWASTVVPVGSYLVSMGVFQDGNYDSSRIITTEAQRAILKITRTSKKASMMVHAFEGGPVPQVITTIRKGLLSPLDGLQRSDVFTKTAQALLELKHDPNAVLPEIVKDCLRKIKESDRTWTDFDAFVASPMAVQIWRGLSEREEDRKFGTWNLDQNHISESHMTEVLHADLRERLTKIGIKTFTEKEKNTVVVGPDGVEVKTSRKKAADLHPKDVERQLNEVQVAVFAYTSGSRMADKKAMLEESSHGMIQDRWNQYGDALVEEHLTRWYHEIVPALHKKYDSQDNHGAKQISKESATLFVPALAAIGHAVQEGISREQIRDWMDSLLELLAKEEADPLKLWQGRNTWSDARESRLLKGSAGVKDRKLTFFGWSRAIMKGLPFDWDAALRDASNA